MALKLGVSGKTLSKIVNEKGVVTPDMALRLSRALGTKPQLWLNLQKNYDLWIAEHSSISGFNTSLEPKLGVGLQI